jgi:hypothetical protein
LIAGESVFGLVWAGFIALGLATSQQRVLQLLEGWARTITSAQIFNHPLYLVGIAVMALLAALMILLPLTSAGDPSEPAPPTAMM